MKCALLLMLVAFAGCQRATPTTFQLNVEAVQPANANQSEHALTFATPANAEVIVESGTEKSLVTVDELNSDGLFTVRLSVTREPSDIEGKSNFTTLIQPQSPTGTSAGGRSTFTKDSNISLTDILQVDIESGEYQLGKPVQLGSLNGVPIQLTVRPISNGS